MLIRGIISKLQEHDILTTKKEGKEALHISVKESQLRKQCNAPDRTNQEQTLWTIDRRLWIQEEVSDL